MREKDDSGTLSCVAIDDEPNALDLMADYINTTTFLELKRAFSNPVEALNYIQTKPVELIFLDVNMPLISGLDLLKILKRPPMCILTTAYSEFALQSYELQVVDYLLKPITFNRFLKAASRALEQSRLARLPLRTAEEQEFIRIKSGKKIHQIHPGDILFVEASGNYLTIYTEDGKVMSLMTMTDLMNVLPATVFFRVHRSFVVNLQKIKTAESHNVEIAGRAIPVSRPYRKQLMEIMGYQS